MPDQSLAPFSAEDLLGRSPDDVRSQADYRSFIKQAADHLRDDDVTDLTASTLAGALYTFWKWAREAEPRAVRLRRLDASDPTRERPRLLLETTGPDLPFLVDSLQAELTSRGIDVLATLHPIVADDKGAQSHIQLHLPILAPAEAEAALEGVRTTLSDVALAVGDYHAMRGRMQEEAKRLATLNHLAKAERDEAYAFLSWLADDHFVFLGSRTYRFLTDEAGDFIPAEPDMVEGSNLGLLRDESRNVLNAGAEPTVISASIGDFLREPNPLVIAKSNLFCRVHRRVFADYVGVKHYDAEGKVVGETRFAGLYTAEAYTVPTDGIPLIRRKVSNVMARSDTVPGSHNAKTMANILENHPRDELFQIDEDTLLDTALGVMSLHNRPRPGVFFRRDRFDRFVTALVYVPRESYDAELRVRIGEYLRAAFDGTILSFYPKFGDDRLARVLFTIQLEAGHPEPDEEALRRGVAKLARGWEDRFRTALDESGLPEADRNAAASFRSAFNAAYREAYTPEEALLDVQEFAALSASNPVGVRAYRLPDDPDSVIRAKVFARGEALPLSKCVPVMENLGLFVAFETGYPARPQALPIEDAPSTYWVHAFTMSSRDGTAIDVERDAGALEDAFVAVWGERTENDSFNQLVLAIGTDWHGAALFRALARYRRQTGLDPSEDVQVRALVSHSSITRTLLDLFHARFDTARHETLDERRAAASALNDQVEHGLRDVAALDEDRALRRIAALINAIVRTNFYHRGVDGRRRPHISFKIDPHEIDALPDPVPFREIFVASPRVEGVHIRFGKVARGGLRWSDRRDDFRTEVLGLVKAQQVKNAVIVPVGAKGGFYPKKLPVGGDRDAVFNEGKSAYKIFVRALLELTDTIVGDEIVRPENTVFWDEPDPYLVVAADKGTATFSDTANEISIEMNHWLGDAFASGGSVGYDHKEMGITARGAWEAVKRHFREMGKDIQSEPFTVIGVGDMSGDVFGNGMLLSKQIRLLAAFDHRHVFLDPDPADLEASWTERKRLFDLPRSTWDDYDKSLISEGGGVFSRKSKSVTLTPQIKALTGLTADAVTPDELIAAVLRAECELLWFGGIGTYVKAAHESHAEVGDKANDELRANAAELRAQVIGEGANLGVTQAGRIAFALQGGRIDTDAIDNSAGVDTSDHEVNIKILLAGAIQNGSLKAEDRTALLASMTDAVAEKVLAHNYSQTSALTLAQASAAGDHEALERLMEALEARGALNRKVEGLPDEAGMQARAEAQQWLTRPELSQILAWTKITLFDDLVASEVPDDPDFRDLLEHYFPAQLADFDAAMDGHRLRREIISTVLANRVIDRVGPATFQRLEESTSAPAPELVRALALAERLIDAPEIEAEIASLDNKAPAAEQTAMRLELANTLFQMALRFSQTAPGVPLADSLARYGAAYETFRADPEMLSTPFAGERRDRREKALVDNGVPEAIAKRVIDLRPLVQGVHVIHLCEETSIDLAAAAKVFTEAGDALTLDRLRVAAEEALPDMEFWDRVATRRFISDLMSQQMRVARAALASHEGDPANAVADWLKPRQTQRATLVEGIRAKGEEGWSFAKFALVADDVRRFVDQSAGR